MTTRKAKSDAAAKKAAGYRAVRGVSWWDPGKGDWINVQPGEVREDIPKTHVDELLGIGAIEPADMVPDDEGEG